MKMIMKQRWLVLALLVALAAPLALADEGMWLYLSLIHI